MRQATRTTLVLAWALVTLSGLSCKRSLPPGQSAAGVTTEPTNQWADWRFQSPEKSELAGLLSDAAHFLGAKNSDPDQALQCIVRGAKADPDNAYWYYLAGAAHARQGSTAQAVKDIRKGNQQAVCYQYTTEVCAVGFLQPYLFLVRELARDMVAQASSLGTDEGADALQAVRQMGRVVAAHEPKQATPVLTGATVRRAANEGLVKLFEGASRPDSVREARALDDADREWRKSIKAPLKAASEWQLGEHHKLHLGLGPNETADPTALPARRQAELCELMATEAEAVTKVLATMPD